MRATGRPRGVGRRPPANQIPELPSTSPCIPLRFATLNASPFAKRSGGPGIGATGRPRRNTKSKPPSIPPWASRARVVQSSPSRSEGDACEARRGCPKFNEATPRKTTTVPSPARLERARVRATGRPRGVGRQPPPNQIPERPTSAPSIPRSHRCACSRALRKAKGGQPIPWIPAFAGMTYRP